MLECRIKKTKPLLLKTKTKTKKMKKLILMALAFVALNASAATTIGIKPIVDLPNCNGANTGDISLVVTGGVSPYTYSWSTGSIASNLTNIGAGSYTVTVTDGGGNTATYTVIMAQPDAVQISATAQNVSQHGGSDGCIHLNVSGGTPDYTFSWSNGSTVESPCGLTAGTYTVTVTDAFGCVATASKTLTQPAIVLHGGGTVAVRHNFYTNDETNGADNHILKSDKIGNTENDNNAANINNNIDVTVYPNPASDYVNVRLESATTSEVTVLNSVGQVVMKKITDAAETRLDLSNLSKGAYMVSVKNENGTFTKTVSVVK
jgi:hypothetical protein